MASRKTTQTDNDTRTVRDSLAIPGAAEPICLDLPPALQTLRNRALALHTGPKPGGGPGPRPGLPDLLLADVRAWRQQPDDEPWLLWRARRTRERLHSLQFELEPGERVTGKPRFRSPSETEKKQLADAQAVLNGIPPFPGGDPGHFHPDYEKVFEQGIGGLRRELARHTESAEDEDAKTFYTACGIAASGLETFVRRLARACRDQAAHCPDEASHWTAQADRCDRIAEKPPQTFHEALQLLFLLQIALWFGEDHPLTSPGRLDQTLVRFYEADRAAGRITQQSAFELLCCLYIQMNRILWPGSAVAVMVGGRDRQGKPVCNDLTYLCLAARQATRLVYPTVGLAWNEDTPAALTDFAMERLAAGTGDPAFFNDDLIADGLAQHGVRPDDRYDYMNSTCVEIKVCGRSNMWVTQPYFNCPQALLDVIGPVADGTRRPPPTYDEFALRVRETLSSKIRRAAERLDAVWNARARHGGFPLASCVIRDCLETGRDFDRGGARYNWVENSFVGLANLVDGLVTIRHLVYEHRELTLKELHEILKNDFEGHEVLRRRILHTLPKYGNADESADALAREWAEFLIETTGSNRVGPHRYVPGFFCWIQHERLGSQTGATPDGRRAGLPLADGAGAAQGRETNGPTAAVLSTTAWNHRDVLGGLVHNIKFPKTLLQSDAARQAARSVIETYLRRGGFEIQVNVVGADTLRDAQIHPENYPDLLVRVAGYSDYFVHLNRNMQDEVISRTEHDL